MGKRNQIFIILFVCMNLLYVGFVYFMKDKEKKSSEVPVISLPDELMTLKVNDDSSLLLEGVSASDNEDGDITDEIFIYSISPFDDENYRTITYAVFDSDDQMAMATRKLKYEDYKEPKFSSQRPLVNLSISSSSEDSSYMQAYSCVDGNISNMISMSKVERDNKVIYRYSVTDSTGTTATLEISDEINLKALYTNIEIELSEYIVYVKQGKELFFDEYIKSINTSLGEQNELISDVEIESNYNADTKGVYEVKYTLNRSNGDYGISKMLVIVE